MNGQKRQIDRKDRKIRFINRYDGNLDRQISFKSKYTTKVEYNKQIDR